jgi:hypothetical protein
VEQVLRGQAPYDQSKLKEKDRQKSDICLRYLLPQPRIASDSKYRCPRDKISRPCSASNETFCPMVVCSWKCENWTTYLSLGFHLACGA